jgi:hypothetical protein
MRDLALSLAETGMSTPAGEPVTDPSDLPDTLDGLLELLNTLTELARVLRTVKREVEAKTGGLLEPGQSYEYGLLDVRYSRSYRWRPIVEAAEGFARTLTYDEVTDVFNVNSMRKTGVEKVARSRGLNPSVVVDTLLVKEWDAEPKVTMRPLEDKK